MKLALITLGVLLIAYALARVLVVYASPTPVTLYSGEGDLTPCPSSPNCVSSVDTDTSFAIAGVTDDATAMFKHLQSAIRSRGDARVVQQTAHYLHAEFKTRWMGYIDDVEVLLIPEREILQLKSASRLGYSDMGANRKRIASLMQHAEDLKAASRPPAN